jgi:hypothetical protein
MQIWFDSNTSMRIRPVLRMGVHSSDWDFLLGLRHGHLIRHMSHSGAHGTMESRLLPTSWPAWPAYSSQRPDSSGGYRMESRSGPVVVAAAGVVARVEGGILEAAARVGAARAARILKRTQAAEIGLAPGQGGCFGGAERPE